MDIYHQLHLHNSDKIAMTSHFQSAPLVASPSYPNSIAWSEENLVAIASGHLITILNPTLLVGPRGLITLPPNKPFPIGVVKREDLLTGCLMPICLSRDIRPCARSISWSHPGFAPNAGCLLAVCTTDGRVRLYRPPFCEYSAEWVEVLDISNMLYDYLQSTKFGELNVPSAIFPQGQENSVCVKESGEVQGSVSNKLRKSRKTKGSFRSVEANECTKDQEEELRNGANIDVFHPTTNDGMAASESNDKVADAGLENMYESSRQISGVFSKRKEDDVLPLITARQYASRSELLSSLIVTWSPVLHLSENFRVNCLSKCSILAVGGKSGNISFWRFYEPECYMVEPGSVSVDAMLIGLLQAHNSWITAISWAIYAANSSESQLIMATGSSDGSVKIWLADSEALTKSSETSRASFSLFKEVTAVTSVPISVISLVVPVQSVDKFVLAIGKGSGELEAWICHISSNELRSAGVHNAHDQVLTGLAWDFDGCCLYSCSQDNSLRSWFLHGSNLHEVPFPSNFHGLRNSNNLSQVSDQCFGLALSPGELMIAVVRSFDANLLNQMYQARTQKAVVEFFWTGGQVLETPSEKHKDDSLEVFAGLSEKDLVCWESNILKSLRRYEKAEKVLVLWDLLQALLIFKSSLPDFVENILVKWISNWFSGDRSDIDKEEVLSRVQNMLPSVSSRRMHLLNILCRRLNDGGLWNKLLLRSELELRERLVSFTFRAVLSPPTNCFPVGVAQIKQWVVMNSETVHSRLKLLESKVEELCRIQSVCEYTTEESCSFCSATVPFESPEVARCEGRHIERHGLVRCAVSMRLCPVTTPLWFCVCCRRSAAELAPLALFTVPHSPDDVGINVETSHSRSKPLCPFCGILLQRLMPDFLLSASPV